MTGGPCCGGRVRPGRGVQIGRDSGGVPHVHAGTAADAWYGLGWSAARDRLWQMEYDRRRARGRWAEVVGRSALAADRLARRLRLADAANTDVAAMDQPTAAAFTAYADGVNAFVATGDLPPEYAAAGLRPEPWTPADSVLAFKVRHVVMGVWQYKVARAALLSRGGLAAFAALDPTPLPGMRVSVPPSARLRASRALTERARAEIENAAHHLGFLAEVEAGSNAWVLGPGRTTTGAPLLANDSHRALDVPNVYWQAHLECEEFTVTGATFPGVPGFPHFGHNGRVGWAITNAGGDAQDLFIERFRDAGGEVRTPDGWTPVRPEEEVIEVRGEPPVIERCWRSPNGPVVHGDPREGHALSLRWTATDGPCHQFGVLSRMLRATGVTELLDAQRDWVDPLNNLLAADTGGHIGYLLRGALPERASEAATRLPVPGWDPAYAWRGRVPFAEMPRVQDPPEQILVTANNTVTDRDRPFVSHAVTDYYRVERIHEMAAGGPHSFADMVAWQGDTVSVAARTWARLLARRGPYEGAAERARRLVAESGGDLRADGPAGLVHACFRRALAAALLTDLLGERTARWLLSSALPGCPVLVRRWFAQLTWPREAGGMPAERIGDELLSGCLERAWRHALAAGDGDHPPDWGPVHRTAARHALDRRFDPPSVGIGGDNETVQAAAYGWGEQTPFDITNLSVYRQVLDLSDVRRSAWIVPGGVSGRPGDPHYADQLADWAACRLRPMHPPAGRDHNE